MFSNNFYKQKKNMTLSQFDYEYYLLGLLRVCGFAEATLGADQLSP
jgi:hypothetical protein